MPFPACDLTVRRVEFGRRVPPGAIAVTDIGATAAAAVGRAAGGDVAAGEMAGFVGCGMLYVE